MSFLLPQSVAYTVYFKAFLSSDHVTEATGKTIVMKIMKAGATTFSNPAAGATNATECELGWYKVALGTGDTDTLGALAIRGSVATIDDVGLLYNVVEANDISDVLSRLVVTNSQILIVKSDTSDIRSNLAGLVASAGILSDINSGIDVIQTTVSDIQSDTNVMVPIISDIQSDTNAMVTLVTRIDSDQISQYIVVNAIISDIQSDTNAVLVKIGELDWSDIGSRLTITNSQLVVVKSDVALIESAVQPIISDIQSDTNVLITTIGTAATGILSDINSGINAMQVLTTKIDSDQTSQFVIVASQFVVLEQNTSDTESALVKVYSDTTAIEGAGGGLSAGQASQLDQLQSDAVRILSDTTSIDDITESLTFTQPGVVDANVQYVNDVAVSGTGADGDEWGPA